LKAMNPYQDTVSTTSVLFCVQRPLFRISHLCLRLYFLGRVSCNWQETPEIS